MRLSDILIYLLASVYFVLCFSLSLILIDVQITHQWASTAYIRFINSLSFERLRYCTFLTLNKAKYIVYLPTTLMDPSDNNIDFLGNCFVKNEGVIDNLTTMEKIQKDGETKYKMTYREIHFKVSPSFIFVNINNKSNSIVLDTYKMEKIPLSTLEEECGKNITLACLQKISDTEMQIFSKIASNILLAVDEDGNLYKTYIYQSGEINIEEKTVEVP